MSETATAFVGIFQAINAHKGLVEALRESACWIPDGSRRTPEQRGAKCETVGEVEAMIKAALERAGVTL